MTKKLALVLALVLVSGCDYNFIGPTINNNNTSSATNNNSVDVHDIVNFAPVPNPTLPTPSPTPPGVETPLPIPVTAQAIAQKVADSNPILLGQSCPETFGENGWKFMDLVIKTLQANDLRWGYFIKAADGTVSRDVIAYRATSDNTGVWGVDIILDRCGQSKFSWQVLGFDPAIVWSAVRNGS